MIRGISELSLEGGTGGQDRAVSQSVRGAKEPALTVTGGCRVGRHCALKRGMPGRVFLSACDVLHLSWLSERRWNGW